MDKKLPIIKLTIKEGDDSGFDFVALVENPAIMTKWMSFSEQPESQYKFQEDKKRRILTGPLMIPNLPIYRKDEKTGQEFAVEIDGDTNEMMMKKFMKNGFTRNINLMHDKNQKVPGAYFMEIWMSDEARGVKAPDAFSDKPDKTIFGSVYFEDEAVYNDTVSTGKLCGFSIEGWFHEMLIGTESKKDIIQQIKEILSVA